MNPVTKEQIVFALQLGGIEKGDVVLMHSALSGIGYVEGGAETVVDAVLDEILYGRMNESVGSSPFNSGLFEAMKKNEAQGIFCGHDHVNDWAAKYEGVWLVYNQFGSYNAYGLGNYNGVSLPEEEWQQGVTITIIHPDSSIDLKQSFNSRYLKK